MESLLRAHWNFGPAFLLGASKEDKKMLTVMKTDKFFLQNDRIAWTQKRGSAWQKRRHILFFFDQSSLYLIVVSCVQSERKESVQKL